MKTSKSVSSDSSSSLLNVLIEYYLTFMFTGFAIIITFNVVSLIDRNGINPLLTVISVMIVLMGLLVIISWIRLFGIFCDYSSKKRTTF